MSGLLGKAGQQMPFGLTLPPCRSTAMEKFMGVQVRRRKRRRGHAYKKE
jgi:hypothetical protein